MKQLETTFTHHLLPLRHFINLIDETSNNPQEQGLAKKY